MCSVSISETQSVLTLSRVCSICKVEKDLSIQHFYWNGKLRQYEKVCIECRKAQRRRRYEPRTPDGRQRKQHGLTYEQLIRAWHWFDNKCAFCAEPILKTTALKVSRFTEKPTEPDIPVLNLLPCCSYCSRMKGKKEGHLYMLELFREEHTIARMALIELYFSMVADNVI